MDNYHSTNAGAGDAEAATPVSPPTESDLSPRPSWRRRLWLKILGLPRRTRLRLIAGAGALALLALIAALVAIVLTVYSWATGPRLIYYQRASDKSTRIDELRIGAEGLRGDFRPRDASFPGDRLVSGLIFEPLIAMGPDGLPENILAEAVEISADGLTYTVRLRRGVKFQEGQTLDAEDVNASVLSLAGQSTPFEGYLLGLEGYEAYINGSAGTIAGVRAPDARTISFTFRFARPENIWLLGMGIQQKESASLRDGPLNGTGPYRFARYDAARSSVELTAHDKYRAGRPAARQLLIAEVGAGEAAAAFRAGDINVFARSYDPAALRELTTIDDANIIAYPGAGYCYLGINCGGGKMSLALRRALSCSIDRKKFAAAVYGAAAVPATLPVPEGWFGAASLAKGGSYADGPYSYDPAAAARLLREAGYEKDGQGLWADAGGALSLRIIAMDSEIPRAQLAALTEQLAAAGIGLEPQILDYGNFWAALYDPESFDLYLYDWAIGELPDFSRFGGSRRANLDHWVNQAADEAIAGIGGARDYQAALPYYEAVLRLYLDEIPQIPLAAPRNFIIAHHQVAGLWPGPYRAPFWNLASARVK